MNRFKELRLEQNLSQKKLAEILKISQSVICDYENGKVIPTATVTCLYADYFSVTTDYLLGREDDYGFTPIRNAPTENANGKVISSIERELLDCFRKLTKNEQDSLLIQTKALADKNK